jgi:hypothetical protein
MDPIANKYKTLVGKGEWEEKPWEIQALMGG